MGDEKKRRVIVFFTSNRQKADEWNQGWGFTLGNLFAMRADDGNVTQGNSIGLPQNFKHLVVWVNGRRLREEVTNQHPQATDSDIAKLIDKRAVKIFEHIKEQAGEANILVASHRWTALSITGAMSVTYHSNLPYKDRDGRIGKAYEEKLLPLSRVEPAKFAEQFDKVWKYLSSAPRLPALKHLSHRIEHIFAPLAIDIQGILQVEPFRRHEYAKKIIESYSTRGDHPFLKLLADLCFLLSRSEKLQLQLQSQTVTVKTDLGDENLPEVRQLEGEYKRMAFNEILGPQKNISCAKKIREICGLDNSWMPRTDSWFVGFLTGLEEAVAKNDPTKLVGLIMSKGKEFLQRCQELHRCFDELERLLPEYAEPPEEAS
jgi:hypothetical protein